MTGHLGLSLRLGLRVALSDAQVLDAIQLHLPGGLLAPISAGRWKLAESTTPIEYVLILRRAWAGGTALQLDWLLSAEGHRELRHRGRYLGEPWMLRIAELLLERGAAAVASLSMGCIWEDGAIDELESLDLPGFDGAVLLGRSLSEALNELLPEPLTGGLQVWRVQAGTWLCSHHFADPWAAGLAPGALPALPWIWLPQPVAMDLEQDIESLEIEAISRLPISNEATQAALRIFLDRICALGGCLANRVPVLQSGHPRSMSEPALRLVLAAQCRRHLGCMPPISGLDGLQASPAAIADLQFQMLGAVHLQGPHGSVVLRLSEVQQSRITLIFQRPAEAQAWQGDPWQLPWIETLAEAFPALERIGCRHPDHWAALESTPVDVDAFALVHCKGKNGNWQRNLQPGWFGDPQKV
jgi:hypothetical protein